LPDINQRIEEARLRKLDAIARAAEAKAATAEHSAAAEPQRQEMDLEERGTRLRLEKTRTQTLVLVILVAIAIQIAAVIISPLLFSLNLPWIGFLVRQLRGKPAEPDPKERDPDP